MTPVVIPAVFTAKDKVSGKLDAMARKMQTINDRVSNAGKTAFSIGRKTALVGIAIAAPLVVAGKAAVDFEDKLADIAKTTGLEGKGLATFGDDLLEMSTKTRSSVDDLLKIGEIGGRLGIAQKDLKSFVTEADKFSVALGSDFSGGVESAITEVGKVTKLFSDTKNLDIGPALRKAGSSFNALSAKGVNVEGLTDFALRVGALPEVMRPTLASSAALGATLQKAGVDAQIGASGFSNFITTAAERLPLFAQQMGISIGEAQKLINTDTATFFAQFSASLKGVPADELAKRFKKLGINSLEVQKTVGAVSGSFATYNELLGISNAEMKNGTSILNEYNTKNNTTAAQMQKLKNTAQALLITIGNALLPIINDLAQAVLPYIKSAAEWVKNNKSLVGTIVKVASAIGIASLVISGLSYTVGIAQKAMALFGYKSVAATNSLGTSLKNVGLLAFIGLVVEAGRELYMMASGADAAERAIARMERAKNRGEKSASKTVNIAGVAFEDANRKLDRQNSAGEIDAKSYAARKLEIAQNQKRFYDAEKTNIKESIKLLQNEAAIKLKNGDDRGFRAAQANLKAYKNELNGLNIASKDASNLVYDLVAENKGALKRGDASAFNFGQNSAGGTQSADNSTTDIKDINLNINGQNIGTFGELSGKETPVMANWLMPALGSTK
jgi:TP901 family phage tail tape measure protein